MHSRVQAGAHSDDVALRHNKGLYLKHEPKVGPKAIEVEKSRVNIISTLYMQPHTSVRSQENDQKH